MSNVNGNSSGGIGFCGLLAVLFIALKLTEVIDWSWWWVLSPLWIPMALVMSVLLIMAIFAVIVGGIALFFSRND